jgi:hypothetical protein
LTELARTSPTANTPGRLVSSRYGPLPKPSGLLRILTKHFGAYRACDQDEEHNRARAGLLPMTEQIARVQFEMP